ncbi:MAG TPA: hypothetical protein VE826_12815 [Dongiaceae bacterium]|nr:hypothetical protein [Dongiaceae bacterium]
MRRINYVVSSSERHAGIALRLTVAPALRAPLAVLACSLALVAVLWTVQHVRLLAAERDGAEYARRLATAQAGFARMRTVERDVARLRALTERVAAVRRSGAQRAGEIAALGNRLPPDAWLTSLRADRIALTLEGHGARIGTVGTAIAGLAHLPPYTGVRLLSVREDSARSGVTYAIALDQPR